MIRRSTEKSPTSWHSILTRGERQTVNLVYARGTRTEGPTKFFTLCSAYFSIFHFPPLKFHLFEKLRPDRTLPFSYHFLFTTPNRSLNLIRSYFLVIHNLISVIKFSKSWKTMSSFRFRARPEKSQLADTASLSRASSKPSTWFPLERHVQEAIAYLSFILFFSF